MNIKELAAEIRKIDKTNECALIATAGRKKMFELLDLIDSAIDTTDRVVDYAPEGRYYCFPDKPESLKSAAWRIVNIFDYDGKTTKGPISQLKAALEREDGT